MAVRWKLEEVAGLRDGRHSNLFSSISLTQLYRLSVRSHPYILKNSSGTEFNFGNELRDVQHKLLTVFLFTSLRISLKKKYIWIFLKYLHYDGLYPIALLDSRLNELVIIDPKLTPRKIDNARTREPTTYVEKNMI
jgi:hypothetical protein